MVVVVVVLLLLLLLVVVAADGSGGCVGYCWWWLVVVIGSSILILCFFVGCLQMMSLKQELERAEERIELVEYRSAERAGEIEEALDTHVTRVN